MSLVRPVERGADHLAADAVTLAVRRVPRQARVRAVQLVAPVAELVVDGLELLVGGPRQTGSPCTARRAVRVPARCSILGRTLEAFGREVNQQEDDGWKIAGQPAHQLDGRVHRPGRSSYHTRYRDRPSAPLSRSPAPTRPALRRPGRAARSGASAVPPPICLPRPQTTTLGTRHQHPRTKSRPARGSRARPQPRPRTLARRDLARAGPLRELLSQHSAALGRAVAGPGLAASRFLLSVAPPPEREADPLVRPAPSWRTWSGAWRSGRSCCCRSRLNGWARVCSRSAGSVRVGARACPSGRATAIFLSRHRMSRPRPRPRGGGSGP